MRKFPLGVLLFLVIPFIEIWLFVQVSSKLGFLLSLLLIVATSLLGGYLLRRQGMVTLSRFQAAVAQGQSPANEIWDGVLSLFGAGLLMLPGFFTDILGMFFLFPVSRSVIKRLVGKHAQSVVSVGGMGDIFTHSSGSKPNATTGYEYEGEVVSRKEEH